jgi:hypothetical protein
MIVTARRSASVVIYDAMHLFLPADDGCRRSGWAID